MDATVFYGANCISKHGLERKKLDDDTAEKIFRRIENGDISDADLSDDEHSEQETRHTTSATDSTVQRAGASPGAPCTQDKQVPDASSKKMNALNWVAQAFQPKNTDCTYKPQGGSVPEEPMAYFTRYFSPTLFSDLATFTNMYVLQTDGNVLGTSAEEIKVFCGILMLMGILKFPRIRMYWQASTRIPAIAESMTAKRFFRIRAALHITDSNAPRDPASQDKFWKVRPVIEAIRSRCLQLEPLEHNSIDEQMIPFTGRVPAKQFVKGKPNPEGVKVFLRCSADGLAHDLELYQGKGTGVSAQHAHLGLGGSVVMRLVEAMPKGKNLKCFMDNYFTSVPLILQLKEMGILASGTIRANRLLKCCLKSEKELKKEGRGSMDEKVSTKGDIAIVRWQDNGVVNMTSTQIGIGNVAGFPQTVVNAIAESLLQNAKLKGRNGKSRGPTIEDKHSFCVLLPLHKNSSQAIIAGISVEQCRSALINVNKHWMGLETLPQVVECTLLFIAPYKNNVVSVEAS
ncbi:piggyBac transposable element-derived protein 3-like [Dermacentor albipictus]|uniref:piggyBac transposable element-derived protein 3-like n=1 Tax=Dermacentor albipictus TaxID=60249 RepID=UPI0038FBE645